MHGGDITVVRGVNFSLDRGETLAIVGESGSGKSQTAFAILGLLAKNGEAHGSVVFDGQEILNAPAKTLSPIRTRRIGIVFQDPMTSLNPYMRVSDQLIEVLEFHQGKTRSAARAEALRMLDAVKIPDAKSRMDYYPHEFSGGMRQRVMIAMSLLCRPDILIGDEPTTALDVTVQAQIMQLLSELRRDFGMGLILITHDLGVVAGATDSIMVMYGGLVMEKGRVADVFRRPTHPYTRGLLNSMPGPHNQTRRMLAIPGNPPNMARPPQGCPFAPRCEWVTDPCQQSLQPLVETAAGGSRACNLELEELQS
ncbi:ATP-binding cassette domain-containing protein [Rhizobium sp. SSA_523]|nr:ATP-binding cassette domain-containing protein [Rhizobium sp. SSA_523]